MAIKPIEITWGGTICYANKTENEKTKDNDCVEIIGITIEDNIIVFKEKIWLQ